MAARRLKVQTLGVSETPFRQAGAPQGRSHGLVCPEGPEPSPLRVMGTRPTVTWVATTQLVEPLFVHQHSKHLDAYLAFRRRSDELDLFIASLERLNKL